MPLIQENKILLYLIMAAGLVLGFLYANGTDSTAGIPQLEEKYRTASLQALRSAHIDDSILSSADFKSLRIFGASVIESAVSGGSSNLFE